MDRFILLSYQNHGGVFVPDSSGFKFHDASPYYALRTKKDILFSMRKHVKQKEGEEGEGGEMSPL